MTTALNQAKWNRRFLKIAREGATWSKDPSTQVGAVIVDQDQRVVSLGYNGPPWRVAGAMAGNTVTGYVPWRGGKQATIR